MKSGQRASATVASSRQAGAAAAAVQQSRSPVASTSQAQLSPQPQRRISGLPKRAIQEQQAHAQQLLESAKKLLEREKREQQQQQGEDGHDQLLGDQEDDVEEDRTLERVPEATAIAIDGEEDQISQ